MRTVTLELQKANTNMINCVIELLDWDELFEGKKVHDQFWLFSKTILKIFTILFPTKLLLALRKIYHGLMMKPDIWQITKVKYADTIYILGNYHYVKSVQIHSFSGPYFPVFGLNTETFSLFSPNAGKYGPEKTPYWDTFHTACNTTTMSLCL